MLILMMAELTENICNISDDSARKKHKKKVWPSWLGRVGFGRVVWQSAHWSKLRTTFGFSRTQYAGQFKC
jgi:hypothetical protein